LRRSTSQTPSIVTLSDLVARLSSSDQSRFNRIYRVSSAEGYLRVPPPMEQWVRQQFGAVEAVETQLITRVDNLVTSEGTLFNSVRARRPVPTAMAEAMAVTAALQHDVWEHPEAVTAEDTFGRITNEHGLTAANVAKYDSLHSIVVFREPDPLAFTKDSIAGQIDLAQRWFKTANATDEEARYPYLLWNCLWRAGGSVVHGHFQVALARGRHYAKIERLRRDAETYRGNHNAQYFEDVYTVHKSLGLAVEKGKVRILASLTPLKEREILLFVPSLHLAAEALFMVLRMYRDTLKVRSFNMGVLMPPLTQASEPWDGFPTIIRLIDRGILEARTSDIGGMELFAQNVVSSDPFDVARALQAAFGKG